MITFEEVNSAPTFSKQLENKILFSNHSYETSVSYQSTYTIKYVFEGLKHYNYNNQDVEVSKGEYLILNNGSQITTNVIRGTKGLSLFLSPRLIEEIYCFYSGNRSPIRFLEIVHGRSNHKIKTLLNQLVDLCNNDQVILEQQKEDVFIQISELIVEEQVAFNESFNNLKITKHDTKRALLKSIIKANDYIQDHFKDPITLDIMSRDIGLSKYYLHRLFKEINGLTPLQYLTKIRLENAKNKLQYSKDSIFEIAIACGFDTISYFSNTFKRHTGLSPSQFRENL
ncbi:AraC family transcriptional regulator [Winogradskyella sp.]|uniref:AraC family transcriptional regulator n=1 Tax=Winogradskyella sp. TaxID=1883156 RepID=UPI00261E2D1F|nr:AraC family transcriptional regulator [Winogradskyella sp.]